MININKQKEKCTIKEQCQYMTFTQKRSARGATLTSKQSPCEQTQFKNIFLLAISFFLVYLPIVFYPFLKTPQWTCVLHLTLSWNKCWLPLWIEQFVANWSTSWKDVIMKDSTTVECSLRTLGSKVRFHRKILNILSSINIDSVAIGDWFLVYTFFWEQGGSYPWGVRTQLITSLHS